MANLGSMASCPTEISELESVGGSTSWNRMPRPAISVWLDTASGGTVRNGSISFELNNRSDRPYWSRASFVTAMPYNRPPA